MPVTLDSTIALIDEFEYLNYLGSTEAEVQINNEQRLSFINWASAEIKKFCDDRIFISPSIQIEEIFSGDGTNEYWTKHGRIADSPVSNIVIEEFDGNNWTARTYDKEVDAERGLIWFNKGYDFLKGRRNWKLKYRPGWLITAVPQDLKGVCCATVKRLLMLAGGKEGITTESFADSTNTYNLPNLIGETQLTTLNRYRRSFI